MDVSLSGKLSSLSLISQKKLEKILKKCGNKKDLIIEPSIIDPLERVCAASWLRQCGVEKIFKLEGKANISNCDIKVYMIPSCLIKLKYVLDQINEVLSQSNSTNVKFSIIMIPKVLACHELLLEEEGLAGDVSVYSYQWEMLLMDQSVYSLELPSIFKSVFINKDSSLLSCISNSLWTLFQVVGKPHIFISVGKQSHSILEMYDVYNEVFDKGDQTKIDKDIGALIVMDRDQDYASSLLTPATYSGLLYETFNTKCGKLDLDLTNTKYKQGLLNLQIPSDKDDEKTQTNKTTMMLDEESDPIYPEIRYRHFSTAYSVLNSKVKELNKDSHNVSQLELNQMKQYVSTKLQQVISSKRLLANHIHACEAIVTSLGEKFEDLQSAERSMLNNRNKKSNLSYLETNFSTDCNMYNSLRLLCLLTLTQGISYEEYTSLVTKYLHAFGYKFVYIFQCLSNAGLLIHPSENRDPLGIPNLATISDRLPLWQNNNFQTTANKFKQLQCESEDMKNPSCPSYVFNGSYVPFIVVLAKILLTSESVNDLLLKLQMVNEIKLGGAVFEECKRSIDDLGSKLSELKTDGSSYPLDLDIACKDIKTASQYLKSNDVKYSVIPLRPKTLLVFLVGGVTQAEIAACHLLEKLTGSRIIIGSDSFTSGDRLIKAAM